MLHIVLLCLPINHLIIQHFYFTPSIFFFGVSFYTRYMVTRKRDSTVLGGIFMKISFIGAGNMASAIAKGALKSNLLPQKTFIL